MPIQFRTAQYADDSVTADKIDLASGTYAFTQGATVQVSTPSGANDAANKSYVDGVLQGAYWKDAVRAATTGNITLSAAQTIDGISIIAGDRVLVKSQTDARENGIYVCAAGSWARAGDMNVSAEFPSAAVFVQEGTDNADLGFVCTVNEDFVMDTDNCDWTQFTGLGQVTAGDGLQKTGNEISVDLKADSGLEISGSELAAKIDTAAGIEFASGAIAINLDDSSMEFNGASGVRVKFDSTKGIALNASNGLEIALQDGLDFEISGQISVQFGDGLDLNANALEVQVDSTTIEINPSNNLQVVDGSLGLDKQAWRPAYEEFSSQTGTTIAVANAIDSDFLEAVCVFRNGQRLRAVPSPASGAVDEYAVAATGVITFGGSLDTNDLIQVDYIF